MNTLCVIPVRGGSKGIPRKNIRRVAGKPLVVWTIEQALAAKAGLDVLVSTDDSEIADVARAAGADVPFLRPAELAQDTTATEPVVRHAIDFRTSQGRRPDAVMLLQATSPLRFPGTLDRAVEQFEATGVDSLVGVVPQTPFLWTMPLETGGQPAAQYTVGSRPRRQELAERDFRYRETGSLYVTRTGIYEQLDNRLGGRIGLFVMDEREGVDVDTELDLAVAEQQLGRFREELEGETRAE
ncbi:acylneuraminate cytidylyltransferase [Sinomonas cyclohexanicum]|uniref:Acylneuraminate cytidylyltransferase n=1 Tax=Sinomonas cyclohexanicum TaxID=322009 RepID=A0ABN6FJV7_SINCY|nr:acylneuraminate cytidylyltransferase family protein [Corynebacterium cyclohexanicum]BCT77061.1 acylneuraminate cytidylyltransferase [Corynebacterium cyclohexanicum]